MADAAVPLGSQSGRVGNAYVSNARAANAMAPVNPASSETHPAMNPATGWMRRERKRYLPAGLGHASNQPAVAHGTA